MKLVYMFLTTVLVLFGGKCVYASTDLGSELTMNELRTALWHVGVSNVEMNKISSKQGKTKEVPEELSKAIRKEINHLYFSK